MQEMQYERTRKMNGIDQKNEWLTLTAKPKKIKTLVFYLHGKIFFPQHPSCDVSC